MSVGPNISNRGANKRFSLYACASLAAVLSLFVLVGAQCAARGNRSNEFDPLGFPGDDEVVTRDVAAVPIAADTASQLADAVWTAPRAADTVIVYRVQFYATSNLAEAEDVMRRARGTLADSLAIDFETPYYKLKAGPFAKRVEAEKLVAKLRASGYESAWVVEEPVVRRRMKR
jgi:cell division septation protein DedD